jgi:hypothetical protein
MHFALGPALFGLIVFLAIRAVWRRWSRLPQAFRHVVGLVFDVAVIALLLFCASIVVPWLHDAVSAYDVIIACILGAAWLVMAAFLACRAVWRLLWLTQAYRLAEQQRQHRFYSEAFQREHQAPLDLRLP